MNEDSKIIGINFFDNIREHLSLYFSNSLEWLSLSLNTTDLILNEFNIINNINNLNDITYNKYNINTSNNINYFINTNNIKYNINDNYSIYQGQYLSNMKLLDVFNILLPSVNQLEKVSNFINFFGYIQNSNVIIFPPNNVRSDWKIIFILFKLFIIQKEIKMDSRVLLRQLNIYFKSFNFIFNNNYILSKGKLMINNNKHKVIITNNFLYEKLTNIYKINQIVESSYIFQTSSKYFINKYTNFI
jgi:hypothetical protein